MTYIGIKRISAEPQTLNGEDGYNVVYNDGYESWYPYESWLPKDVFERMCHENGKMSFSEALYAARHFGAKIARAGWNGKKQYITVASHFEYDDSTGHNKVEHKTSHSAALVFHGTLGDQVGWLASQADMLSDDWCVVE